jgi:lysophospholipase L1-like esterase
MVDLNGGLKVPEFTSDDDLVHPNLAGYKVMEEIILKALK